MVLLLGACVLAAAAVRRGAEYDEAYSLFVVAGTPRPDWPAGVFAAGRVREVIAGRAGPRRIAAELRATDVHPPLYFWALAFWRRLAGHGLLAARMLSVLAALAALAMVGAIAAAAGVASAPAMLFTLGCYGFAYTGAIARNFALAQALALGGVWLALRAAGGARAPRAGGFVAGLVLGAASFTNYLAAFTGGAVLAWLGSLSLRPAAPSERRSAIGRAASCGTGMALWLPAGLWFFLAQRDSREGQFPPFRLGASLALLARDAAGAVFGGLPLYVAGAARIAVAGALAAGLLGLAGLIGHRWRAIGRAERRWLLGLGAVAPAVGLLGLGLAFDTTPIELRYLAFATPFFALLLAGALAGLRRRAGWAVGAAVLAVQALALAGLLTRAETTQPARAAAAAAARLAGRDGLVLLPHGNDGVGVVGPFLAEAPPWLLVRLATPATPLPVLRAAATGHPRVVLALIGVDRESRATLPRLRAAFAGPGWRVIGRGFDAVALAPAATVPQRRESGRESGRESSAVATPAPPAAPAIPSRRGTSPRAG